VKRLFRWAIRAAAVCAILCIVLVFLKDALLKLYFEQRIGKETGMKAKIGRFHWGLTSHAIAIENLTLYNAPEFGGEPFLHFPELRLEFVRSDLVSGRLHLKDLRVRLAQVRLVKNKAGKTNVTFEEEEDLPKAAMKNKPKPLFEFAGIDRLQLTVGKIVYTDLLNPANNAEYDLGVRDEIITDIKSESDLTNWVFNYLVKHELRDRPPSLNFDSAKRHRRARNASVTSSTNATAIAHGTNDLRRPADTARGEKR
jgi:uncharacterized protein involved in outer membrane biogenesis